MIHLVGSFIATVLICAWAIYLFQQQQGFADVYQGFWLRSKNNLDEVISKWSDSSLKYESRLERLQTSRDNLKKDYDKAVEEIESLNLAINFRLKQSESLAEELIVRNAEKNELELLLKCFTPVDDGSGLYYKQPRELIPTDIQLGDNPRGGIIDRHAERRKKRAKAMVRTIRLPNLKFGYEDGVSNKDIARLQHESYKKNLGIE